MDKIYKNKTPKTSTMNFQFKNETIKDDEESENEEVTTMGRLRIESIDNIRTSSHDIDKQINDLEALIKRLQDEIIDMSNDVEQPVDKEHLEPEASPHHLRMNIDESEIDPNRKSHIYSVVVNDSGLKNSASNPFSGFKIVEPSNSPSTTELEEAFLNIRRDFSLLWDEIDEDIDTKKEDVDSVKGNLKETLSDFKSTISEIINYQESLLSLEEKIN